MGKGKQNQKVGKRFFAARFGQSICRRVCSDTNGLASGALRFAVYVCIVEPALIVHWAYVRVSDNEVH